MKQWLFLSAVLLGCGCTRVRNSGIATVQLGEEAYLTLLSTNDIHGGVEPSKNKDGKLIGGMAIFGGVVNATRQGIAQRHGDNGTVILLDAGDQFQGTLISNYNKGQLVFATMNQIRYDAVIPGNHDFDFGPADSIEDTSDDPTKKREALERLVRQVDFPLISANTFYRATFKDVAGHAIPVEKVSNNNCAVLDRNIQIDWSSAKRPDFLKTRTPWFVLKQSEALGVKIAVVGFDHPRTSDVTTFQNVSDLCFAEEYETYRRMLQDPAFDADIVILVMHQGNTTDDKSFTALITKIASLPNHRVGAVISGHTHWTLNERVGNIPMVQSGSGGQRFGRIDLVWNRTTKSLVVEKMKVAAGIELLPDGCDTFAEKAGFCAMGADGKPRYDSVLVSDDAKVKETVARARADIAAIATEKMGDALRKLTRDRILESNLADAMADNFRAIANVDVTLINTGGLRTDLDQGPVTYEDLFKVFPFNNHAMVVEIPADKLVGALAWAARTCGSYGSLMQSGLRVTFRRNCTGPTAGKVDPNARLVRVETVEDHRLIFDEQTKPTPDPNEKFRVATFSFLLAGGDGYADLKGFPVLTDLGVFREMLRTEFKLRPAVWSGNIDGRWSIR